MCNIEKILELREMITRSNEAQEFYAKVQTYTAHGHKLSFSILAVGIDDKILLEAYPKEFYHLCQS